ncbi:VOC family protein [Caulobacter sp. KR2-114]|uniref:VOC family protein n=1 Tax=Caulobacter sp. KR2-114 TaxID=3400912 RepID=UPI003C11D563
MTTPSTTAAAATGLAGVRALSHVALEVSDLEASIAFYEAVLGFEIFQDSRMGVGQPNVKGVIAGLGFELAQSPTPRQGAADRRSPCSLGIPCLSFTVADAAGVFARLKAGGWVDAAAPTEFKGAKFFFAFDPDGHPFELIEFPKGIETLADIRLRNR